MWNRLRTLAAIVLLGCSSAAQISAPFSPQRVVFIGDSIINHLGNLAGWFGDDAAQWVNAGVGGDASIRMINRISTDVPSSSAACVILIGINDFVGGAGTGAPYEEVIPPGKKETGFASVGANIRLAVEQVQAMGIRPILVTVLPVTATWPGATGSTPASLNARVVTLNAWLREYGRIQNITVIDANRAFVLSDGFGDPSLYASDGLHPNDKGNAVLTGVIGTALRSNGFLR